MSDENKTLAPDKVLGLMTSLARLIALNRKSEDCMRQLIRSVACKDRKGTISEASHFLASVEFATGLKERYEPKSNGHLIYNKHSWPTHFRRDDLTPVKITETMGRYTVYGFHPKRSKIVDDADYNEEDYISFDEVRRGERT